MSVSYRKIRKLQQDGKTLREIVEMTGEMDFRVAEAMGLGENKVVALQKAHVLRLRKAGKTRAQVKDELGLTSYQVSILLAMLIAEEKIEEKGRGRVADSKRDEKIIKMRNQGKTNQEIADALGDPLSTIANRVTALVAEGKLKKRPIGAREGEDHHGYQKKEKQKAEYLALVKRGQVQSIRQAAGLMNVSYATAKTYNRELVQEGKISA